jgi:hypothetical protein
MTRRDFRWLVVVSAAFLVGCGSGGIAPGVPKDTAAPTNPTPDMGPDPKGQPVKKTP